MYEDHPKALAPDIYNMLMYGDTAAGRPIVGYEETVNKLTKKDLDAFRAAYYHPERTVVVISGAFDTAEMLAQIKKLFSTVPKGRSAKKYKRKKPSLTSGHIRVRIKKSEQTHLVLGVPGLPVGHKDEHTLALLTNILGGGMSSRLFQRIREDMGAAYYVGASNSMYPTYGNVTFYAGVPHAKVEEVVRVIKEECDILTKNEVGAEELARVKNYTAGNFMLALESSDAVGEYYGGLILEGQPLVSPVAHVKLLRAVTSIDIKRLARTLFKPEAFRLAIVGPRPEEEFRGL
jgi:predicted Zn-dependent peptidase